MTIWCVDSSELARGHGCLSKPHTNKENGRKEIRAGRRQQQPSWMCVGAAANAATPANNTVSCLARGVAAPASKRYGCYLKKIGKPGSNKTLRLCLKKKKLEIGSTTMTTLNI